MNDIRKWAGRMSRIGRYKRAETGRWLKSASTRQRIRMTEELLLLDDVPLKRSSHYGIFTSLSRLLDKRYASKA